jgi:dihydroxyacetone kinase DhaKLM complex PTS-EIIA-like component DhaM
MAAIDRAWSNAGVVILVDLGGAETNSEMAIEMLPDDRRGKVLICNAPVVEGAVVAATEAAGGSSVDIVQQTAEEYSAR